MDRSFAIHLHGPDGKRLATIISRANKSQPKLVDTILDPVDEVVEMVEKGGPRYRELVTSRSLATAQLGSYGWFGGGAGENSNGETHPVGEKLPNQFGLYDTYGNVPEWVEDCYVENYAGSPSDGTAVGESAYEGGDHVAYVFRGGGWDNVPAALRSAARRKQDPGVRSDDGGFRIAKSLP